MSKISNVLLMMQYLENGSVKVNIKMYKKSLLNNYEKIQSNYRTL